jgi:hypothetical protein
MRTAVGMSSGFTVATSGDGADGFASPAGAGGWAGSELAFAVVVAGGFFAALSLAALSLGPAATLVAMTSEENTTTVEVARMRNLQPALAGDFAHTARRTRTDAFSCGMLQL